jgi:hypothetical protein
MLLLVTAVQDSQSAIAGSDCSSGLRPHATPIRSLLLRSLHITCTLRIWSRGPCHSSTIAACF